MIDRTFQDENSFEVSTRSNSVEVYVFDDSNDNQVMITGKEEAGWDSQSTSFVMTPAEATALKEFLINQGY